MFSWIEVHCALEITQLQRISSVSLPSVIKLSPAAVSFELQNRRISIGLHNEAMAVIIHRSNFRPPCLQSSVLFELDGKDFFSSVNEWDITSMRNCKYSRSSALQYH